MILDLLNLLARLGDPIYQRAHPGWSPSKAPFCLSHHPEVQGQEVDVAQPQQFCPCHVPPWDTLRSCLPLGSGQDKSTVGTGKLSQDPRHDPHKVTESCRVLQVSV